MSQLLGAQGLLLASGASELGPSLTSPDGNPSAVAEETQSSIAQILSGGPSQVGLGTSIAGTPGGQKIAQKIAGAVNDWGSLLRPARIAAFVVGLLLIAGGIFALKPVRETVGKASRAAGKAATLAAEAG